MERRTSLTPRNIAIVLGAAVVFTFVQATANRVSFSGLPARDTFGRMLVGFLPVWLVIAALIPFIDLMVRRFPWTTGRALFVLPIHFVASVVFAATHLLLLTLVHRVYDPPNGFDVISATRFLLDQYVVLDMSIYWGVAGTLLGLHHMKALRDRDVAAHALAASLAEAQLHRLRGQLQPHFLFNSLNTVAMQVRQGLSEDAIDMLAGVSELLRVGFGNDAAHEIALEEEIENAGKYLRIERIRFGARLHLKFNVADDVSRALVPTMLLQPLIENAIRHGISVLPDAGHVLVWARRDREVLRIDIVDDGPGPRASSDANSEGNGGHGIGIANTRERLRRMYGKDATLSLSPNAPRGARCTVVLPFHTMPMMNFDVSREA